MHTLRATRYLDGRNTGLADFVARKLHYLDFPEALRFYRAVEPTLRPTDQAFLACNDRFYLMVGLLNRRDMKHPWIYDRCREVEAAPNDFLDLWSRYHYKAVDLDEPVPTPLGWRSHGSLKPGDEVFGPDGAPTRVIAKTEVFDHADCFRVTMCDGYSVVVSGSHLWTLNLPDRRRIGVTNQRRKWKTATISTRDLVQHVELAKAFSSRRYPSIPIAAAVQTHWPVLPLQPYVLGVWLGDGTTGHPTVTAGEEDVDELLSNIRACDVMARVRPARPGVWTINLGTGRCGNRSSSDVANALRQIGVYRDKHIPRAYMTASVPQRMALLQGLMDTDGSCAKACGQAIFCAARERLASDVFELAQSLGLKPTIAERASIYDGKPYRFWQVQFVGRAADPPFRLKRKIAACSTSTDVPDRRVMDIQPVASRPVSCIQVERPDGLYLIGKNYVTTHNSSIITTGGTIQEILTDPEMTVAIFSHNKSSANKMIGQIKNEFERNNRLTDIFPDVLWKHPKRDAPRWSETGITLRRSGNPKEATVEGFGLIDGMPTGGHWKMLIYDDIVTERVTNPDMVRKATEAWELSTNLGVGEGTKTRMVGTRYSYNDPYTIVMKRGIVERRYPATDNGKLEGNPVLYSQKWWEDVKMKQRGTVAAQMLQNPLAGSENVFKPEWFKGWEIRPSILNVYIMVDPNKGHSRRSDRTGIAVVGVDGAGMKYLLDGYRHRMSLEDRWVAVSQLHAKWSTQPGVGLCEVGYERYGEMTDENYFRERMRDAKSTFQLKILNWASSGGQSKKDRVERLEPDFRRGRFQLPAVIYDAGFGGPTLWRFVPEQAAIQERPMVKPTSAMMRVMGSGASYLAAKPIVRKDEDGRLYDVTLALIDEMLLFPFAPKDDLVDALSRIYDMDVTAPSIYEDREVERLSRELEEAV